MQEQMHWSRLQFASWIQLLVQDWDTLFYVLPNQEVVGAIKWNFVDYLTTCIHTFHICKRLLFWSQLMLSSRRLGKFPIILQKHCQNRIEAQSGCILQHSPASVSCGSRDMWNVAHHHSTAHSGCFGANWTWIISWFPPRWPSPSYSSHTTAYVGNGF